MTSIPLHIHDETSRLRSVVVGIAENRSADNHQNNPKYVSIVARGEDPTNEILSAEMNNLARVLEGHGVKVYRPHNIPNRTQIFARDIAFVIGDTIVKSNMLLENRRKETAAIDSVLSQMEKILTSPSETIIEGGDVILYKDCVFVGIGARTNKAGYDFLANEFKSKQVIPLSTVVSTDPMAHIVHLDCAFQPVGDKYAILFEEGFVNRPDEIYDIFGEQNLIKVTSEEMYHMYPNIFSVAPDLVVVETGFTRLIAELEKRNIETEKINYSHVAKLGGMLRCSTLPLCGD